MRVSRRHILLGSLATMFAEPARAQKNAPQGLDATQLGVRPNATTDQTQALQRAIDRAAQAGQPLWLPAGTYRSGPITLRNGSQLTGVRGATKITLTHGPSLITAQDTDAITLSNLTIDGNNIALGRNGGLINLVKARQLRITNCAVSNANGNALGIVQSSGAITGNSISNSADNALYCLDNNALDISGNIIAKSGNGGIRIWQSSKRHDGSVVAGNTIEDTEARAGGDGQNGNAVNVFRAAGVTVRGNTIRRAAFTAVRGNSASHIQIIGNQCFELREVAIYSEFEFIDATIADNLIDGTALGIAVTNADVGGRGAIVRNNIIRNITYKRPQGGPDSSQLGIGVEMDTQVIGNTVENAPNMGIEVGTGKFMNNCVVTGNIVRMTGIGIGVSVAEGAGSATISDNRIIDAKRGAILGMEWDKAVTGDLVGGGAGKFPKLKVSGNRTG
ncbi:MAG: TIGR03808 family TAT-translocated repetitive protein [Pseudolabrys sp.]|nr:TIGR03808 family TAT-translocated repetitive protein [Pseudolabrys sp.]